MNYYVSEGERQYQEHRRAQLKAMIKHAEVSNNSLVGEVKIYKGVSYQMHQRGSYVCVGLLRIHHWKVRSLQRLLYTRSLMIWK